MYKEFEVFKTSFQKRRPQINEYFKKSKESKHINEMSLFLLQWPQNFYFILFALFACGILTTQHSSLARYPENGKNPLNIYTAKLPLIKKQILFMDLLEDAIKRLTRHSTESF